MIPSKSYPQECRIVTVGTHHGHFHADEVFAIATIFFYYSHLDYLEGKQTVFEIYRTRNPDVLKNMDWLMDVGGEYDPERRRFDHHQKEFDKVRKNGVPYASFGLVWEYISQHWEYPPIIQKLEEILVQTVDSADAGKPIYTGKPYTVSSVIASFNPSWDEENTSSNERFAKAVLFAYKLLDQEMDLLCGVERAHPFVKKALKERNHPHILVLDKFCPWQNTVSQDKEVLFTIFPSIDQTWCVQSVPVNPGSFERRALLPPAWRGERGSKLNELTQLPDCIFCHRDGFIGSAETKESAIKLAEMAIEFHLQGEVIDGKD